MWILAELPSTEARRGSGIIKARIQALSKSTHEPVQEEEPTEAVVLCSLRLFQGGRCRAPSSSACLTCMQRIAWYGCQPRGGRGGEGWGRGLMRCDLPLLAFNPEEQETVVESPSCLLGGVGRVCDRFPLATEVQ